MRTPSRLRTRFGLWTRMLVAGVILVATMAVAVAAEFLLVFALLTVGFVVILGGSAIVFGPAPAVGFVVGFVVYCAALVWFAHGFRVATSDDLETGPRTVASEIRRTIAAGRDRLGTVGLVLAVVGTVALVLGALVAGTAAVDEAAFVVVPLVVSLCVVGYHLVSTVRTELSGDVAVLRTLDETVARSDDLERDPELEAVRRRVERLAGQVDVPAPDVRIAITRTPTAMTAGYRPAESTIVVSRGLLEDVDDRELEAVLAHELAHVANRDAALMSAMSVPVAKAEAFFERFDGGGPIGLLLLVLQGLSRWTVIVVARYREYVADGGAVAITGDPAGLASALETLDRSVARRPVSDLRRHRTAAAFSIVPPPWEEHRFFDRARYFVQRRLLGTHPPTDKRIERLRSMAAAESAAADRG